MEQTQAKLDHIAVVLHRPRYAGNVGSVARCMKNMGLQRLIVSQGGPFERDAMVMMSTHFAADIVDGIAYYDDLKTALADFQYVVGMTARLGAARGPAQSPREMAARLVALSQHNRIALLSLSLNLDPWLSGTHLDSLRSLPISILNERLRNDPSLNPVSYTH
ncbi:MAG: hypothetical protein N2Z74_09105, partial [Syntrophales bacterium]|nr:hypothetical protein [Syntrophales bacterium]